MRPKLVVGNWKMNPATPGEASALARAVMAIRPGRASVGVAPPSILLPAVAGALRGSDVRIYAQDVHWEEAGAYTGQISAAMVAELGAGSIVGHSEVRRDQGDTDARVARKATAELRRGLRVIYCLGESLDQRRAGRTSEVIATQVREGIGAIAREALVLDHFAIAYEPIWAIGTGVVATPAQASAAIATVRMELTRLGIDGDATTVMYGGSVSAANRAECAAADGVDGALVGGASLKAEEFAAIVAAFASDPRS